MLTKVVLAKYNLHTYALTHLKALQKPEAVFIVYLSWGVSPESSAFELLTLGLKEQLGPFSHKVGLRVLLKRSFKVMKNIASH